MGSVFTSIANKLGAYNDFRIIMTGLDGAGKSTILHSFMQGEKVTTVPSPGSAMEVVNFENVTFCVFDMGEKHPEKAAWADQLIHARALIFVVDAHDRDRILEAR
jgi:GTPase SAR1 family protein